MAFASRAFGPLEGPVVPDRSPLTADAALNLALAVVASSTAPLLLLDEDFSIIAASSSFCRSFDIDPAVIVGKVVFHLGQGEWDIPQLRTLLATTLIGHAVIPTYEMDLKRPGSPTRCLSLNAQNLNFDGGHNVRLMLTVADITDARAAAKAKDDLLRDKDNLLREKAVLMQELHHRIANSLQIIASVLMQSARRAHSDEARRPLFDAHSRVMSISAMQRQLSASTVGDVELRWYFTDLCNSIAASMISDPTQLSLGVNVDESVADADTSVSLGLLVTELVINALKHAFPEHRHGAILVSYKSKDADWTLSVGDDGVGMPPSNAEAKPGLGTSIIEALARKLDGQIKITDANPGTLVSISHTGPTSDPGLVEAA